MKQERLAYLLQQSMAEQATDEERAEMLKLISDPVNEAAVKEELYNVYHSPKALTDIDSDKRNQILEAISQSGAGPIARKSTLRLSAIRWAAAAAIALIVCGVYFFNHQKEAVVQDAPVIARDIVPGDFGATLTLSNGTKIRLTAVANGELVKESGISISKTADGQLVYKIQEMAADSNVMNTLSTAKGETYQVRLPDGSLIYLNAASSLTYNASLIEKGKRVVKLRGEGYFEVAKDKEHPFIVETEDQKVEVLGTHFNISSYADDHITKTTLLEGAVRVSTPQTVNRKSNVATLVPGQQSRLINGKLSVGETDTDLAIAWKNNEFTFESETIETVMKMVERWYNVEVIYVGEKTRERFSGGVSRFDKVSKVLEIVESTGTAHFEIKGRKIYVSR